MSNVRITAPAVEPVSVEDFKIYAKIDSAVEDDFYEQALTSAREYFELTTGLALISQTWRLSLDQLPGAKGEEPWWDGVRDGAIGCLTPAASWIELPMAPLVSITSFTAYQQDNTGAVFAGYFTDTDVLPGRLILNTGSVWPAATRTTKRYVIDYVAGFGAAAENVPADIRLCIKQLALHFNENRELVTFDTSAVKVPVHCERLMSRRKIRNI